MSVTMSPKQVRKAFEAWHLVEPALFVPHDEREYKQLVKLLDHLIDEVGEEENHPLASLMEVIGVLIEKYEDAHVPVLGGKQAPYRKNWSSKFGKPLAKLPAVAAHSVK